MTDDTAIIPFRQPGSVIDPLTEIARDGARRMLMAALKSEADGFVARFSEDLLDDGRQRIVRHGAGPERVIQARIGPSEARRQKVRDRAIDLPVEAKIRFTSNILQKWARRSKSLDALLPCFTCAASLPAIFRKRCLRYLGQTPRTCCPASSRASPSVDRKNTTAGRALIARRAAASTSGLTGSACRRGGNLRPSASS